MPISLAAVTAGAGFYGLLLGVLVTEFAFVGALVRWLRVAGYRLDFGFDALARIFAAAAVSAVVGTIAMQVTPDGWQFALLCGAATLTAYAMTLRQLRPLHDRERATLERLLGRKLDWL